MQIEQERKKRGMKTLTFLQKQKVLQGTQELSNRGHTNKTWKHASKIKATKCAYRQDERKCAYCPGETTTLYSNTTAVKEEPQDEWYDGDYDAMVRVDRDCRIRTDNGASQKLHKQKSKVFTYVSPPCQTYTTVTQERMQRLQMQEMVVQDLVNKRLIGFQQQAPRNSTMQVICSILATTIGIMTVIVMVLLVKVNTRKVIAGPDSRGEAAAVDHQTKTRESIMNTTAREQAYSRE